MNEGPSIAESQLQRAAAHLCARIPAVQAVYLFGSTATAMDHPGSDVDLAVLADSPVGAMDRFELRAELADILGREVDLVDLRQTTTVMRVRIVTEGRRLFARDGVGLEAFESFALSDYARLNEERAGILDDIRERGSVHD